MAIRPTFFLLLLMLTACGPNQTQSVHLPLAVGNRWVYDVQAGNIYDVAILEVVGEDGGVFALSAQCTVGHWTAPVGPFHLMCRDSVLWLSDTVRGLLGKREEWRAVLSDDPKKMNTQNLLLFRGPGKSRFETRFIPEYRIESDTYHNCLALHNSYTRSFVYWLIFWFITGRDSVEAEEVYCPDVGLVSFTKEHHWWTSSSSLGGGSAVSDSGIRYDRWLLRSYSLKDR